MKEELCIRDKWISVEHYQRMFAVYQVRISVQVFRLLYMRDFNHVGWGLGARFSLLLVRAPRWHAHGLLSVDLGY